MKISSQELELWTQLGKESGDIMLLTCLWRKGLMIGPTLSSSKKLWTHAWVFTDLMLWSSNVELIPCLKVDWVISTCQWKVMQSASTICSDLESQLSFWEVVATQYKMCHDVGPTKPQWFWEWMLTMTFLPVILSTVPTNMTIISCISRLSKDPMRTPLSILTKFCQRSWKTSERVRSGLQLPSTQFQRSSYLRKNCSGRRYLKKTTVWMTRCARRSSKGSNDGSN